MNGWIKLHRKVWDSPHFQHRKNKSTLVIVWIWLLTHANKDGVVTFGRNQIANDTGLHSSSVQRAVEYFSKEMRPEVIKEVNKLFTKITISNWGKYQGKPIKEVIHNRSITDQQPITNKNKEVRSKNITNVIEPVAQYGNSDVNKVMDCFEQSFGMKPNRLKANRNAAHRLVTKLKDTDKVCRIIKYAASIQGDKYSPTIGSVIDVEDKLIKLVAHSRSATRKVYDAG